VLGYLFSSHARNHDTSFSRPAKSRSGVAITGGFQDGLARIFTRSSASAPLYQYVSTFVVASLTSVTALSDEFTALAEQKGALL
jgi:hypothetical protein